MKRITFLFTAALFSQLCFAQYSQNFDTLTVGDYIGVKDVHWTTWSGATGGAEDAQVNATHASSGSNSIYFNSTASGGGPQDAVLLFGGAFNTGNFEYEHAVYVEAGKGAYFNFQAESTIGTTWALDCQFVNDSMMYISYQGTLAYSGTYPVGTWFDFKLDVNLNTNTWEVLIDNVSKATFQNDANKIASIDIFPVNAAATGGNNLSRFWIDDVSFMHTPYTLPSVNGGVYRIDFKQAVIANITNEVTVQIRNLGTTAITSFDIELDYNGVQTTQTTTGVNIAPLATYNVVFTPGVTISGSATSISATISNVNGLSSDGDATDDMKTVNLNPIVPAPGKVVVVEEATGTWCGWCPRGTVAMDFLARDYHGIAAGIAVHDGDPMVNSMYNSGIGNLISGYPSALVERGPALNPNALFSPVNQSLVNAPTALLVNGAKYTSSTGLLEVSITVDFQGAANSNWKLACAITEDNVTGTASGYAQTNYYAGGSQGPLIGPDGVNWANLPATVPASQMVYNHVARGISPSFGGNPTSFPANVASGSTHTLNFNFVIDPSWDTANMHIVGMLLTPTGTIDNGSTSTMNEAIANGFVAGNNISVAEMLAGPDSRVSIYPNPTSVGFVNLKINTTADVTIKVVNINGAEIFAQHYDNQNAQAIKLTTQDWADGVYVIEVTTDNKKEYHRLIVQ